ncbi:hypothetical protein AUEXF2481DRAFT_115006 [Aureobasidium subglaciale EXF-2481]|uniref:Protein EFR3 n=1 Tax=Aureobasidium subglaciale (strain EXF-2481) TaxID=1043005 RepID=A0A074ZNZ9_AURSE|nr:uncharacterized protein AUEXF2481DRAFT_115006 [Aureobasidium subglaciale EXF-2481]KAI5207959.1 hypothetical protein E4T38_03021 [Aureobasidium subglaciale]KAI5226878.1 hypothetical protein E4T40_02795 [Aureobasidium subglaciale]KAI5230079.1 hypothetical protein E4T41_03018 [Aureobasidium subglaciale]KAI5264696.1 hypothetical protein E4T46_02796 [Aureobasidium subglaciale]KER00052.1 hypothetical protein AUEXF2481DRAFT_115006 [Aureobasidium subglaciale EXF-2481]
MNALRQKCRPKHQVLILKCYPKLPKNAAGSASEAKPNGSELSYLVYYASSRRAKLTKVGSFLEKRTASDVYKGRIGAVHVTLGILHAFLNSSSISSVDTFPLFAPHVLSILQEVLGHSNDTGLIEACLPVWDAFCRDQDHATLAADVEYRQQFANVVKRWTTYADKTNKEAGGSSDALKLRKAGLEALRSVAKAQALASEPGRQISVFLPAVLRNLYSQDATYLTTLHERLNEQKHAQQGLRPSMQTIRSTNTREEGDPRAAGGTAQEADRFAEEEAGTLAMQCFKALFDVDNRGQVRMATLSMLEYISQHTTGHAWSVALVKLACESTPVQDRFVVLFTAVEILIRSPIVEDSLQSQIVLAVMVKQVLGSNINLIGLSVMDILLGLVQHVLLVLQLGTTQSSLSGNNEKPTSPVMEVVKTASPVRVELLTHLRQCIVNLAMHVYYTDQISDMISAILLRLKPASATINMPAATANAIEDPNGASVESTASSGLRERSNTDGFFSFDTAREVALDSVKRILIVANNNDTSANEATKNQNPVPIGVWEGTQWLLRDSYRPVRVAYVDALCTWLDLETREKDSKIEETITPEKHKRDNINGNNMARRAVSNASARGRGVKKGRSFFLQLLHLAVYEDALHLADRPEADHEFLLLHYLLASIITKLGINAARSGLPMIFRLQEDIQKMENPKAKVRLGSLVHGYLWAVAHRFNFEHSVVGNEIQSEIVRRQQSDIWVHGLQVPAVSLARIAEVAASAPTRLTEATVESQALRPFDHREQLIERISDAYSANIASPPGTPGSPGRSFSLPSLSVAPSDFLSAPSRPKADLPQSCLEELTAVWTKEELLATIAAAVPKSTSLSGSRAGTSSAHPSGTNLVALGDHRRLLAAANTFPYQSPRSTSETFGNGGTSKSGPARVGTSHSQLRSRLVSRSPAGRRPSNSTSGHGDGASSVTNSGAMRIEELKRVLAGQVPPSSAMSMHRAGAGDDSSESMMDVEDGELEDDASDYSPPPNRSSTQQASMPPPPAPALRLNSGEVVTNGTLPSAPVSERGRPDGLINRPASRRVASRSSARGFGGAASTHGKKDLRDLLSSIGTEEDETGEGVSRAPY